MSRIRSKPPSFLGFVQKILGPVVEAAVGAKGLAGAAFVVGACGGEDAGPQGLGDLNRGRADAGGAAVDKEAFARLQPAAHDHVGPDGEAGFGQAGGFFHRHPVGDGQGVGFGGADIFGIAAAGEEGADLVADLPARHAGADFDDCA